MDQYLALILYMQKYAWVVFTPCDTHSPKYLRVNYKYTTRPIYLKWLKSSLHLHHLNKPGRKIMVYWRSDSACSSNNVSQAAESPRIRRRFKLFETFSQLTHSFKKKPLDANYLMRTRKCFGFAFPPVRPWDKGIKFSCQRI